MKLMPPMSQSKETHTNNHSIKKFGLNVKYVYIITLKPFEGRTTQI